MGAFSTGLDSAAIGLVLGLAMLSAAPAQAAPVRNGVIAYSFVEQPSGPCDGCDDTPSGGRSWIELVQPDGTRRRRLPCTTGSFASCHDLRPRFSYNGERLAILNQDEIVITRMGGEVVRRIAASAAAMAWAPDGERIAYTSSFQDSRKVVHHRIYITRLGGAPRALAPAADVDPFGLTWSGRNELAWERVSGRRGVYVSGPRGQDVRRILPAQDFPRFPRWSRDGQRVAYACGTALCAARSDGRRRRVLTRQCVMDFDHGAMAWSPDGRFVACIDRRNANLITVRLSTGKRRLVRRRPDSAAFLPTDIDWRPRSAPNAS